MFCFISEDDYNIISGSNVKLNNGDAVTISERYNYKENTISFNDGRKFTVIDRAKKPKSLTKLPHCERCVKHNL